MSDVEPKLVDGRVPATPEALMARLAELGIAHETRTHAPVFTVEEARRTRGELQGAHVKNLFIKGKRKPGRMWLVTCLADRRVDLASLAAALGERHVRFGSPERLMRYLGVIAGAVTPFAVVNDRGRQVRVALDSALRDHERVNAHPLDNAQTTGLSPADLIRFLEAEGHPPTWLRFSDDGVETVE